MSTLTTPSSSPNKLWRVILVIVVVSWMAIYPIYQNYYRGNAIEQYQRHQDFMAGRSMFYNPWQYRVLCPWLVEGAYRLADATVFGMVNFSSVGLHTPDNSGEKNEMTKRIMALSQDPSFVKYNIIFIGFRLVEHLVIFWLAWIYFSQFFKNHLLIWCGLMFISLSMGNAVIDSDLSFNTYMDVILYLLAGIVITRRLNAWWIVVIAVAGAFNRETSLLIPLIYFASIVDYSNLRGWRKWTKEHINQIIAVVASLVLFAAIFALIRTHYGYVPATRWRVPAGPEMLKLNLFSVVSAKTYMEMFGVFGILPFACMVGFKRMNSTLKIFFLALVPVWFAVHLWSVVCYQTRLFLVPTILVFLPAVLELIEKKILDSKPV